MTRDLAEFVQHQAHFGVVGVAELKSSMCGDKKTKKNTWVVGVASFCLFVFLFFGTNGNSIAKQEKHSSQAQRLNKLLFFFHANFYS